MPNANLLAVLVSGIISMFIGALWYSPLLFGKQWIKLMGFDEKELEKAKAKGMGKSYFTAFIATLFTAYVIALFVSYANATTFTQGLTIGFWAWIGFIVPVLLNSVLWENKPQKLYAINIANYLVVFLLIGGILAVWS